jgi:uracil-DNA glycosylase
LNATLTVRKDTPNSHKDAWWQQFTDAVIKKLSDEKKWLVFLLRGAYAQGKIGLIDQEKHLVLQAAHPSPFSAHKGFFGCKHFSKTNDYLISQWKNPINWFLS